MIYIDASKSLGVISPLIFGMSDCFFNKYLRKDSRFYKDFSQKVNAAGITNFRFQGDMTNIFHWKDPEDYLQLHGKIFSRVRDELFLSLEEQKMISTVDDLASFIRDTPSMSDAVIGVNFGRGTAQEAAEWVRYANVEKGYGIKYWTVGNELSYGTAPHDVYCWSWFSAHPEKYYFGGYQLQKREWLGVSNGKPSQIFTLNYPPVKEPVKDNLRVYVDNKPWVQVEDINAVGCGPYYQYREIFSEGLYYRGEVLFGDGKSGIIPPSGSVVTADYNSGPHDGLVDFISAMKAVDPTIKVGICGDEIDWFLGGAPTWTKRLLELDEAQDDPNKEFDFITIHWHTIRPGDSPYQALHRQDNFDHAINCLRETMDSIYKRKRHKRSMPIFITEWKAVHWSPPMPQGLFSVLFAADALGRFARNGIFQASMTHVLSYLKTDGLLSYEYTNPDYEPNQPMPIFFAFQLISKKFGRVVIESRCDSPLRVYATLDREENPVMLCLLVINRDDAYAIREVINIKGFEPKEVAEAWMLNGDGLDKDTGLNINGLALYALGWPKRAEVLETDEIPPKKIMSIGQSFEYTFPAHSLTIIQIRKK